MSDADPLLAKYEVELRRGASVLAVLCALRRPQYGYSLRQALNENGMPIEEGTLYPLLRRLEGQGLLESEWLVSDGPPRRYYQLSVAGHALLARLSASWANLAMTVDTILKDAGHDAA